MALKFLNKKGWHTGSLRNIENVWKAEQKHDAEQKKLEELRKQIQEERERSEFRQLQEQAGLVPRQERLDFMYESGLGVGKASSDGFKALEAPTPAPAAAAASSAEAVSSKAAVPGALFEVEDKPQSANDAWRKLHSDPLLLIRQREQEALARIKNNPIQMAMIRKSVEAEKKPKPDDKEKREKKNHKRKHHHRSKNESSDNSSKTDGDRRKRDQPTSEHQKHSRRNEDSSEDEARRRKSGKRKQQSEDSSEDEARRRKHEKSSHRTQSDPKYSSESEEEDRRKNGRSTHEHHRLRYSHTRDQSNNKHTEREEERRYNHDHHRSNMPERGPKYTKNKEEAQAQQQSTGGYNNRRKGVPRMTEKEREAKLREMQMDAELHEEQRWKRIKKAAEADAREAVQGARSSAGGNNFLDAAQKSIYGTEKGGSTTIEESVRRRAYYSQGGRAAHESNAFRR